MNTKKNITAYSIQDFSQCQYKTWLDYINPPNNYPKNIDPWLEIIRKIGLEHEEDYLQKIKESQIVYEIDKNLKPSEKEKLTEIAIKNGEDIIYQPYLKYKKFTGSPDFLVKKQNYYEPWDIKSSFKLKPENILQICHYSFILEKQYNNFSPTGKIILRDESVQNIEINKYYDYFLNLNKRVENFIDDPKIIPEASKCNLCNVCDYKLFCENNWKNKDHLNQVANIKKNQINILENEKINTLEKLAKLNIKKDIKGINKASLDILVQQAKLQLNYRENNQLEHKIIFEEKKKINDQNKLIGFELLPPPSENDLFFDIEGYPMYFDSNSKTSGLEYLFGIYYRSFGKESFRKFLAINNDEEKIAFEKLVDFIFKHLNKYKDAHVYHYNSYEETALKKLSQKYEVKIREVDFILRENKFIDLFKVVKDSVLLSVENYRLKTIEKFYNLDREEDIASGQDSLVAFENYLESGHKEILEEIILYNKQDCKSLIYLQSWLEDIKPKEIKYKELEEIVISERSLEIINQEKEVENIIDNLKNEDVELKPILSQLNFYNRKEQRAEWWNYFSNIQKNTEDLIEDNNCIGALNLISKTEEGINNILEFKFPNQITKMKTGDYVLDQNGKNSSSLVSIDYTNCLVKLKQNKKKEIPYSLTPSQPLNITTIDNSVADFIKDFNYQNSYPAIKDFLNRNDSRYIDNIDLSKNSTIEEITKRIKNLNSSYLVMQGPPGTGKSYASSRVILDLIKSNYRVAIVCHSHKAIINLLESIDSYSNEKNISFKGIYNAGNRKIYQEFKNIEIGNTNKLDLKKFQLVAGTAWALSNSKHRENSKKDKIFDFIFFDEAGQLSISKVIASSLSSKNIVMIGDHMQLPQPSLGIIEGESSLSPIEYLIKDKNTISDEKGIFLEKTFRMHSSICEFISNSFYEKRLITDKNNSNQKILKNNGESVKNGIYLVDLNHSGSTVQNLNEVVFINNIYKNLINKKWINRNLEKSQITNKDVLVVSPFNAQVNLLKENLPKNAQVGTIDNFQGQEAPIVIISYTSSDPESIPRGSDFFFDFRRLNVSLSRAKCIGIIILNNKLLNYHCSTIEDMERLNYFCKLSKNKITPDNLINLIKN
mgnify:FL=1